MAIAEVGVPRSEQGHGFRVRLVTRTTAAFFNGDFAMNKLVLATASVIALSIAGPGGGFAQTASPSPSYQGQPSGYGQPNTGTPSYQGQPSANGQSSAGAPSYQGQPLAYGQANAGSPGYQGQPSTYGQVNTGQPSGQPSYGQANPGMQGTYGQPSPSGQTMASGAPDVQQVQEQLKSAGRYRGRVDGQMGPATRRAIARFQRQQGLRPTGVPDEQTLSALTGTQTGAGSTVATPGAQPSGMGTQGSGNPYANQNMRR